MNAKPGTVTVANRAERRAAVRAQARCCRCNMAVTAATMVWDDNRPAHRECSTARNEAIAESLSQIAAQDAAEAAEATRDRVKAMGLVVPAQH